MDTDIEVIVALVLGITSLVTAVCIGLQRLKMRQLRCCHGCVDLNMSTSHNTSDANITESLEGHLVQVYGYEPPHGAHRKSSSEFSVRNNNRETPKETIVKLATTIEHGDSSRLSREVHCKEVQR